MKLSVQIITLSGLLMLVVGCGNNTYNSSKIESKIVVDGSSNDWSDIPLIYIEDLKMVIGLANNDSTLFAMFRFSDHQLAQKLHIRGAILWIDPTKDKEKQIGIRYRRDSWNPPQNRRAREESLQQKAIELNGSFVVVHGEDKISSGLEFNPGVLASAGNDNGLYIFEFAIPLNSKSNDVLDEMSAGVKNLSIGVEFGGMTEDERNAMRQMMAESDGGGPSDGGMKGGGRGGRRQGGRNGKQSGHGPAPDMESEEVWLNVKIAY